MTSLKTSQISRKIRLGLILLLMAGAIRAEESYYTPNLGPATVLLPMGSLHQADGTFKIPILCYHNFHPKKNKGIYSLTPAQFEAQLLYLKRNKYNVLSIEQLYWHLATGNPVKGRSVVITIDDGYPSIKNYAVPLLRKYGMTATLFIYTDNVMKGKPDRRFPARYMTWQDLEIFRRQGFSIQSHSLTHARLDRVKDGETKTNYRKRIYGELVQSYEKIYAGLGGRTNIFAFAFPYGAYSKELVQQSFAAGYTLLLTTDFSDANVRQNNFVVGRYTIHRDTTLEKFAKIIGGPKPLTKQPPYTSGLKPVKTKSN